MSEKREYHTKQHRQLLDFFDNHPHESFSARDLIDSELLNMGEATIYRLLTRLTRDGELIRSIPENGGGSVYTRNTECSCHGHIHLKCTRCSEVICADPALLGDVGGKLDDSLSFSIDSSKTTIYGVCKHCRSTVGD